MATVANRYTAVLGPIKMEILNLSAITDADTVTSQLQNPSFALGVNTTDGETTSAAFNPAISGRTITLNNANFTGSTTAVLLVFGF
jgi:hypothetical protein